MSSGSESLTVPTAEGCHRTKLVGPNFCSWGSHTALQHPHIPASSSALDGKGDFMMEKRLQTIGMTGSHSLFALSNALPVAPVLFLRTVGSHRAGVGIRAMLLLICSDLCYPEP